MVEAYFNEFLVKTFDESRMQIEEWRKKLLEKSEMFLNTSKIRESLFKQADINPRHFSAKEEIKRRKEDL